MKTKIITALGMMSALSACSTTYLISTDIARDGSTTRELTEKRGTNKEPFLSDFDDTWTVNINDSVTMMKKKTRNIGQLSEGFTFKEQNRPLATPVESLKKRFRWFYTRYDFKAVYPEITDKGEIPLNSYLDAPTAALWFRGDISAFRGMNGVELKETLDEADEAFARWFGRSIYEIYSDVVAEFTQDDQLSRRLAAEREKVFADNKKIIEPFELTIEEVCGILDNHFSTGYFAKLYDENKTAMESRAEELTKTIKLFETDILYSLAMPGEVVSTNGSLSSDGRLEWKVDGWRILASNYTLEASSRVPNYWAWIVTLLAIAAACVAAAVCARSYLTTMRIN
jgi:hypothetical protein